jgi:hypothetical protein
MFMITGIRVARSGTRETSESSHKEGGVDLQAYGTFLFPSL